MAAKTVLNYLPRESVIHKLTGTTACTGVISAVLADLCTLGARGGFLLYRF